MANNKSIQILRGTQTVIVKNNTTLADGQPLYNSTNNWLTVGGGARIM